MKQIFFLFVICGLSFSFAHGEGSPKKTLPLDEEEKLRAITKVGEAANDMLVWLDKISNKKYQECITSTGDLRLCGCLREKLPVAVEFVGYVAIVTHTKEELEYSKMGDNDKKIVDLTRKVRDECVQVH